MKGPLAWSNIGCILGVMGAEKERCHIENKYDCKLYSELDISRMKIKASSNLHASWGTQWTCENEGNVSNSLIYFFGVAVASDLFNSSFLVPVAKIFILLFNFFFLISI